MKIFSTLHSQQFVQPRAVQTRLDSLPGTLRNTANPLLLAQCRRPLLLLRFRLSVLVEVVIVHLLRLPLARSVPRIAHARSHVTADLGHHVTHASLALLLSLDFGILRVKINRHQTAAEIRVTPGGKCVARWLRLFIAVQAHRRRLLVLVLVPVVVRRNLLDHHAPASCRWRWRRREYALQPRTIFLLTPRLFMKKLLAFRGARRCNTWIRLFRTIERY
mmetsp:Transcript_6014/g.15533  ORF Transcript_6014/g.15533 Transcript_6014/m.15533 type:complete len:219 (+) Transcript_6014:15-671(+)